MADDVAIGHATPVRKRALGLEDLVRKCLRLEVAAARDHSVRFIGDATLVVLLVGPCRIEYALPGIFEGIFIGSYEEWLHHEIRVLTST